MKRNVFSLAEYEGILSLSDPIYSKPARWERKLDRELLDRHIPHRSSVENNENMNKSEHPQSNENAAFLYNNVVGLSDSRVLLYKKKSPAPCEGHVNPLKVLYSTCNSKRTNVSVVKAARHIPSDPVRVLDAPGLMDDYYLNLLTWSQNGNLAVALNKSVYTWNSITGCTAELLTLRENTNDYVSAVSWLPPGEHLAVGTTESGVRLWDVQAQRQVRSLDGHSSRVNALAWNGHMLTSGSRDNAVINHDVRVQNHIVGKMLAHSQEVCSLSWSPGGTYLASGANDNTLCITEMANFHSMNTAPKHILTEHQAAVKALAWSPHERNLLASGGGTADRCIKFWNAASGSLLSSTDTGSQVCSLQWSPFEKEILSSHGYVENQLCLWKYPTMAKVKELHGHTGRVLHTAVSPDGTTVCSASPDETLRLWTVFGADSKGKGRSKHDSVFAGTGAALSPAVSVRIR